MLPDPDPAALATDTYLRGQLGRYLAGAAANPPEAGTAAAIWIGANDYNGLLPDARPRPCLRRSRPSSATPSPPPRRSR